MYLHLGSDVSVFADDVVGIFDYKLRSTVTFKEFIDAARWDTRIRKVEGETKAVVVTKRAVYLVPVSRTTLVRRWQKSNRPFFHGIGF